MSVSDRLFQTVTADTALTGRTHALQAKSAVHAVNGSLILGQPAGTELIFLAAGCYWGVEEIYWNTAGIHTTAVGYMGGHTENPTYEEVCTGFTGHTETVRLVYDPKIISIEKILKIFFECHDPTSLNRQGNDFGTQYRSAVFPTTELQLSVAINLKKIYQDVLTRCGKGRIVTQIHTPRSYTFYPAEQSHQQYLYRNPDGYRCHSRSGIPCPIPDSNSSAGKARKTANMIMPGA